MKPIYLIAAALIASSTSSQSDEYRSAMEEFYNTQIASWISDPVVAAAVMEQNTTTAALSDGDINALDQAWRAEVGAASTPTITPVLENDAAGVLRSFVDASGGMITEIFAMDARGLNVASSAVTSDYWQGDEAKFSETFPNGAGTVHYSDIEFDESSQSYQGQISVVLVDPETKTPIGAMTVGVNADALM
jgi:hypothetical protein